MEGELGSVVECLARGATQSNFLINDPHLVQIGLHVQDGLLGGFEDRVEAPQDGHGQDDVPVFAADVNVTKHVIRNAPDVIGDPVEVGGSGHKG